MGGSEESEKPDDGGSVDGVPTGGSVPNGGRLRAAEVVALKLGDILEEVLEDLRSLPWWRPALGRRGVIEGKISMGLVLSQAWRDAFDVWPEQAGNGGA